MRTVAVKMDCRTSVYASVSEGEGAGRYCLYTLHVPRKYRLDNFLVMRFRKNRIGFS